MKAIITAIIVSVFWFCFWLSYQARPDEVAERHIRTQQECIDFLKYYIDNHVSTFKEIQERVGAEPDGIIGPNTIAKWDKKICQQEASKWDFYYEGDKK